MTDPKPCPICQATELRAGAGKTILWYGFVECECGCNFNTAACYKSQEEAEAEAITAWNTRQPDPRVSALVETLDTAHHSLRRGLEWIEHNEHEKGRAHIVAAKTGIDRALTTFKGVPTHD